MNVSLGALVVVCSFLVGCIFGGAIISDKVRKDCMETGVSSVAQFYFTCKLKEVNSGDRI